MGSDMNANLPAALLAFTLLAGMTAPGALAQRGPVIDIQAQSKVPPAQAVPCPPAAKPLSTPGQGQTGCQSDGVIHPPMTGDQGVVKPPETSNSMPMPVIPPPGSPGGNPSVQPK
jgi:hypothetical protein